MTTKEVSNETKGEEILVPCMNCTGKTAHDVVASLDQSGSHAEYDVNWDHHYQIIQCKGCKTLSFRDASSNSEDYHQISPSEWELVIYEKIYPSRIEGRKDLGEDGRYLPADIQRIYDETVRALNNDSPVLAGIGLRVLVETVCKAQKAKGSNLLKKIDDLALKKILTPAGAKILHRIRSLGNAAAHEVKPHTEKQLALAMNVVEHLLKDVYILPRLVEFEFDS